MGSAKLANRLILQVCPGKYSYPVLAVIENSQAVIAPVIMRRVVELMNSAYTAVSLTVINRLLEEYPKYGEIT